ncbi:MAG: cytochrome c oxidase subunit II [Burkholderiaceae bacterium]|nr:cytochrome c oxidase subunit II [Burkholderiales bacterium]MCZ8336890.1 cytochrome c oxidase subunit II [Burkholderiaceae bacterium]
MPGGPGVNQLNLTRGVTRIAADQWWIHNFLLIVCLAIFVAVFGVMFYSLWAHRKSRGAKPADFHESTAVEIAWTIVPFLIIVGLAIPATRMVVEQKDTSQADLTIKATGYQWKWGYEYLKGEGAGISFLSDLATPLEQIEGRAPKSETYLMEVDNPLVVPVGQKIRMVITANDVIHAWMVPAFGVKQDAIPGFVRDTWFRAEKEGTFRGACAELCGKNHAFMPIVVEVKSQEAYKAWADGKKKEMLAKADDPTKDWTVAELNERGAKVYASNCVACHQGSGKGVPGAFPALEGSKLVLGRQEDQIAILLNGKPGTSMAAFKQLSDVELAAVATYTRNAWGNKAEDTVVQPKDFTAARK